MRVDFLGASAAGEAEPAKHTTAKLPSTAGAGSAADVPQDTASLSTESASVPALTAQALATAGAREARVETLRRSVAEGSYTPDPAATADAMIRESA